MPVSSEERTRLEEVMRQSLAKYSSPTPDQFTRSDLGQLSFEELRDSIAAILEAVRLISTLPYADLPFPFVQQLLGGLSQVEARLTELERFDILELNQAGQNPINVRQNYLSQWDGAEIHIWAHLGPVLAFLASLQAQRAPDASDAAALRVIDEAQRALAAAETSRLELADIVRASRDAAAEVGASKHATLFKEEADEHAVAAIKWLWATIAFASLTTLLVAGNVVLSYVRQIPLTQTAALQLGLAKVLAFSVLLSATVWCGKVYRAARHNEVVNRHRQNALGSFEAFVKAATDDQTKNAVLLHASQSIFSQQSSGFGSSDGEPTSSHFVELVRTVSPAQKSS
jgi:hypothetical protein